MPRAAAIYARISSDPTGTQLGVARQVHDCFEVAGRRGWPVVGQYIDDDRSAYSGKPRPEYRRLLEDIEAGTVDAVVVWHLDRLHRQPRELEEFFDICDRARLTNMASVSGDTDLSTHDGRFMARILGAVARKESDHKSERIRRKHLELAQSGAWKGGGTRPFGYLADRTSAHPVEAALVREAVARVLAGDSLRSLAADFNARGVPTVSGGPWSTQVLRRIVLSARISGQREHRGQIVGPAKWDALITPADSARVRTLVTDPSRVTNRNPRRYALTGLLYCGLCDSRLVPRPRVDGVRRYVCARVPGRSGCGKIATLAEPVEQLIEEALLLRLDSPQLAAALRPSDDSGGELADLRSGLDDDEARLTELATAYGEREITFAEYMAARKPIEARLGAARRTIARSLRLAPVADYVGAASLLRSRWLDLPLSRQRAVVAAVLERAIVGPAVAGRNFFDPSRIAPVWRV